MKFVQKEVGNENIFQNPLKNWKWKLFLGSFSLSSIYIISYFYYNCLDMPRNSQNLHNFKQLFWSLAAALWLLILRFGLQPTVNLNWKFIRRIHIHLSYFLVKNCRCTAKIEQNYTKSGIFYIFLLYYIWYREEITYPREKKKESFFKMRIICGARCLHIFILQLKIFWFRIRRGIWRAVNCCGTHFMGQRTIFTNNIPFSTIS